MTKQPCFPFRSEQAKAEYEAHCLNRAKAWPVSAETKLIDTASGQTFVRTCGSITDPPLVLLPGGRSGSLMWTHLIGALSANYRAYALDTLGDVGFSLNRRPLVKPEDLVNWLEEVLAALIPDQPVSLMGISYGGWLAGQYALRFPNRVRNVVLLAPACTVFPVSFGFLVRMGLLSIPIGSPLRRMLHWIFRDAVTGGSTARALVNEAIADVELAVRLFDLPRPVWPTVIDDKGWQGFRVPCLFLVGEHEKIYSAQAAVRRLDRVAPRVRSEIIHGAGHDLTMVQADLVLEKVLRFLGEQRGQEASAA